jgi:hypothetical protein
MAESRHQVTWEKRASAILTGPIIIIDNLFGPKQYNDCHLQMVTAVLSENVRISRLFPTILSRHSPSLLALGDFIALHLFVHFVNYVPLYIHLSSSLPPFMLFPKTHILNTEL